MSSHLGATRSVGWVSRSQNGVGAVASPKLSLVV